MHLSPLRQEVLLHIASFLFLLIFTLSYQLRLLVFLLALSIMIFNLWRLLRIIVDSDSNDQPHFLRSLVKKSFEKPYRKSEDMLKFQLGIKQAYKKKVINQNSNQEEQSQTWSNHYSKQFEGLQELRNMSLVDLRRDRINFSQDPPLTNLTIKSFRYYFLTSDQQGQPIRAAVQTQISDYYKNSKNANFKSLKLQQLHVRECYTIVRSYINTLLDIQTESIYIYLQEVERCLQKCFSLGLTFEPYSNQFTITYRQLMQLTRIIAKKAAIPNKYILNMSSLEVKQAMERVSDKILRLPNFNLPPNILRLAVILKHIREDFPHEQIVFGDYQRQQKVSSSKKHIFRIQNDDRCYYHNYSSIKTKCNTTLIVLFLLHVLERSPHTTNPLIKQIRQQLGLP